MQLDLNLVNLSADATPKCRECDEKLVEVYIDARSEGKWPYAVYGG